MKRTLCVLFTVLMITSLFTGCVTTGGQTTASPAAAPAADTASGTTGDATQSTADSAASGPKRDTLNLSINQTLNSVDGQGPKAVQEILVRFQIFEGLFYFNEATSEIENRLCAKYDVSADGLEYVFYLQEGVKFQNGDEMKASDVAWSLLRAKEQPGVKAYAAPIKTAEAVDDYTVKVTLNAPSAPFMTNLCYIFIMSEREVTEQGEQFGTIVHGAGTGPYMLKNLDNDVEINLVAFPDYWRGEASIKNLNYYVISDASAALIAFESGDLDWYSASTSNYEDLKANPAYKTELVAANHITYYVMNPESNEALKNDLVRKAIAYATDKEAMNYAAFDGYAIIADYMEYPVYNVGAPSGGTVVTYDPEYAKQLLAEAGYPNGCDIGKITCFTGSHFEKCAQVLQENLAAVGIKAELEWVDQTTNTTRGRAMEYATLVSGSACTGDYDNIRTRFHEDYAGTKMIALETWENGKFKDTYNEMVSLIGQSSQTLDAAARIELDQKLSDLLIGTYTLIPLLHKAQLYVWNADLSVVNQPNNYIVYNWSWK